MKKKLQFEVPIALPPMLAQVTLLKQYHNYSRPGYWAAYVLIGSWL